MARQVAQGRADWGKDKRSGPRRMGRNPQVEKGKGNRKEPCEQTPTGRNTVSRAVRLKYYNRECRQGDEAEG